MDTLNKHVSEILYSQKIISSCFEYFPCIVQREKDSACVLFMGPALAEGPREHPWLMSLTPTNGAIRCQCKQKYNLLEERNIPQVGKKKVCYDEA